LKGFWDYFEHYATALLPLTGLLIILYFGIFRDNWSGALVLGVLTIPPLLAVLINGYRMLTLQRLIRLSKFPGEGYDMIKETLKTLGWRIVASRDKDFIHAVYPDVGGFAYNTTSETYGDIFVFAKGNVFYVTAIPEKGMRGGRAQILRIHSLDKLRELKLRLNWMVKNYKRIQTEKTIQKEIEANLIIPEGLKEVNLELKEIEIVVQNTSSMPAGYKFEPYKIFGTIIKKVQFDADMGVKIVVMLDRKIEGRDLALNKFKKVSLVMFTIAPRYIELFYSSKQVVVKMSYFKQSSYNRRNNKIYLDYKGKLRRDETIITLDAKIQLK